MHANNPLPAIILTAVGSRRQFALHQLGQRAVLIVHNQHTYQAAVAVNPAVRKIYPSAAEVLIVSVFDAPEVPRLLRGVAEGFMEQAYHQAAASLPDGFAPAEYVILLPDWEGRVRRALGFAPVNQQAGIAIVDSAGFVVAQYQGADPAGFATGALAAAA
ncbi:MAG: hypothetical protein OHK0052_25770 [Anaerolineales bacterium]